MTSLSKDSLQSVLAKVEELSLPEGEYLELCSVLKKQFELIPPDVLHEEPRSSSMTFHGKRVITIKLLKRIVYKGTKSDVFVYSVNGVEKQAGAFQCGEALARIHQLNHTKKITLDGDFETTFAEHKRYLEEQAQESADDDDDYADFRSGYVFAQMIGAYLE